MDAEKWQEDVGTIEFKAPADALKAKNLFERIQQQAKEHENHAVAQAVAETVERVLAEIDDTYPDDLDGLKFEILSLQPDQNWLKKHDSSLQGVVSVLVDALKAVRETMSTECFCEGCTCGDGWEHDSPELLTQVDAAIAAVDDPVHFLELERLKARVGALEWVMNHWPPLGALKTATSYREWINERESVILKEISDLKLKIAEKEGCHDQVATAMGRRTREAERPSQGHCGSSK